MAVEARVAPRAGGGTASVDTGDNNTDGCRAREYVATAVACDSATKMCDALFDKQFAGQCIMYLPPLPPLPPHFRVG